MVCHAHLGEVLTHYPEIQAQGAEVVVVTQTRPDLLVLFLRDRPQPFPFLTDPSRQVYRAFGLEETSLLKILRPGVLLRFLRLLFRGWLPRFPKKGEKVLQLGGDFVLDKEGRLVYAYRSTEPTDRPAVTVLLDAIRKA